MRFTPLSLKDAWLVEIEPLADDRGFFARTFCKREMAEHGLSHELIQLSTSFTKHRGTLRGLHYQIPPVQETKLVRVTAGAIWDAIIDLRPGSPTFLQWVGIEISGENRRQLYVPPGFGHGWQALTDNVEVLYQMNEFYHPETVRATRYDDPTFCIPWPVPRPILSDRDRDAPAFDLAQHRAAYGLPAEVPHD